MYNAPARRERDDLCILLVEDDDADAYLTKRALLQVRGVSKIVRAKDGQEALTLLASNTISPDLAFVDLQMPTMDGLEFLSACVEKGLGDMPMIVLTSSSAQSDAVRSRVRGALHVITKPESPDELGAVLREAVGRFAPAVSETPAERAAAWGVQAYSPPPAPRSSAPPAQAFGRREFGKRA